MTIDRNVDRAREALRESRERHKRSHLAWREAQQEYGKNSYEDRYRYSRYLSACIELRRTEHWFEAVQQAQRLELDRMRSMEQGA